MHSCHSLKPREVSLPLFHPPHFLIKLLGKWHVRRGCVHITDGVCESPWIDLQQNVYTQFETRELRRCAQVLEKAHSYSDTLHRLIHHGATPALTEADRLRDADERQLWHHQLREIHNIILDRELECVNRCMEKDALCKALIISYLEGCAPKHGSRKPLRCKQLNEPLFDTRSAPWQHYRDRYQGSDRRRQAIIDKLEGGR